MPDEAQAEGVSDEAGEETRRLAMSGPANLVNGFILSTGPSFVRITFCEQASPDADPQFRAAIVFGYDECTALAQALQEVVQQHEDSLGQMEAGAEGNSGSEDD